MNEECREAYGNLIDALLDCDSDEEVSQILDANRDLIDAGLQQIMLEVAEDLRTQGDLDKSNFLMNIVEKLMGVRGNIYDSQLNFLKEVLQATQESNSNPQVVYRLLKENLNLLDDNFAQVLRDWTDQFPNLETELVQNIAAVVGDFSSLIAQFSSSNKATNLEIAIAGYEAILNVFTSQAFPEKWATTQMNLGRAYFYRIQGDGAENVEQAILCYQNALKVYNQEQFPQEWVDIQNNLATVYNQRIREDRLKNLKSAIDCYKKAKVAYTTAPQREVTQKKLENTCYELWGEVAKHLGWSFLTISDAFFPPDSDKQVTFLKNVLQATHDSLMTPDNRQQVDHLLKANLRQLDYKLAEVLLSLALCSLCQVAAEDESSFALDIALFSDIMREFPQGDRASNLEIALVGYMIAGIVLTQEVSAKEWAQIQNNLGVVYFERIQGEKAENLENAIHCFQLALEVRTRDTLAQEWAETQINLGIAYRRRIRGNQHQNLEAAIWYFQAALEVRTYKAFPEYWAETQVNLGNAYCDRFVKGRAKNLEIAIGYYQNALKVYTPEQFPQKRAETQINLGNAYCDLGDPYWGCSQKDREKYLEAGIECLQDAANVLTDADFPQQWIITQLALGSAYRESIQEDKTENLEAAIHCLSNALDSKIISAEAFPERYIQLQYSLGLAYEKAGNLKSAKAAFSTAIDTVESLRGEIFSGIEEDKQRLAEEWNQLYRSMVAVNLEMHNYTRTIEWVERSKTRNLFELLARRELYPQGEILEATRNELRVLRQEINREKRRLARETKPDKTYLNQLHQKYNQLFPDYQSISFDQIQNLIDEHTAIIQWYILFDYFCVFIITQHNSEPYVWKSSAKDLEQLEDWNLEYLESYHAPREAKTEAEKQKLQKCWETSMEVRVKQLAEILHIDEIIQQIPQECDRLILIPHLYLHLFPLHALPISSQQKEAKSEILMHRFPRGISYAPSCQLLELAQTRKRL
ncbi:MAG: hypothetical protein WBF90_31520 [Rivularia sp. (in: cyanobacteria)]